jgi:hypothetical protein
MRSPDPKPEPAPGMLDNGKLNVVDPDSPPQVPEVLPGPDDEDDISDLGELEDEESRP